MRAYLENVRDRLLLVDFLFHYTVLVHTDRGQHIKHRLTQIGHISFGHSPGTD